MEYTFDHIQHPEKKITSELSLDNFEWGFNDCQFNRNNGATKVSVAMRVKGTIAINVREFDIAMPGEWTAKAINLKIMELEPFKGSKPL